MTDDASSELTLDLTLRDRFLAGQCTPEELAQIQALSAAYPDQWDGLVTLRAGFDERRQIPAPAWQDAWGRWKKTEHFSAGRPIGRSKRPTSTRDWRGISATFAGAALLIVAIATLATQSYRRPSHGAAAVATFATNATQQASVTLDDGTRIVLSPRTTLHAGGIDGRTVTLDSGEAYFDVATHASAPFTVRSGTTTTRVLGTTFLVRHDPRHAHVRVAVTEGKVQVTSALAHREDLTVTAGQIGDLTDSTTRLTALDNLPAGMERKRDEVVFHRVPVESVLGVMGQWYGLQFRCADSTLLHRSVTIGLSTQSSAQVFAALQQLLEVNVAVRGDTVTLATRSPRPRTSSPRMQSYDSWSPTRENGR